MSDSSDSEAPETISLQQTKLSAKEDQQHIQDFEKTVARKRKMQNKKRDEFLKTSKTRSKPLKQPTASGDVDEAPRSGLKSTKAAKSHKTSDDSGSEDEEEEYNSDEEQGTSAVDADHLPDHLFETAFAQPNAPTTPNSRSSKLSRKARKARSKLKVTSKSKEMLIGPRTFRISEGGSSSLASLTVPHTGLTKFVEKRLKGGNSQGWERRPVNIGVMKGGSAPSVRGFVRG